MIKYSKQSLKALSEVGVGNVVSSVVYVIRAERFELDGRSFLRVYLLLTRDVRLLSVDFRIGESEVKVTKFVSSSTFYSDSVVECEIALDTVYTSFSVVSVSTETGDYDCRSDELVVVDLKLLEVKDSFLVSNFANYSVFPEVYPSYWMCTCGHINSSEHSACENCKARFSTISDFVSKGVLKVVCEQYMKLKPFVYYYGSFNENLSKYVSNMVVATTLSENDIRSALDIESLARDYEGFVSVGAKKKRVNNRMLWVGGSLVFVLLLGYVLSVTVFSDYITYIRANGMFEKGEYASASVLYEKLGEYKDSASKGLEAKYHVSVAQVGLGEFSSACTFFERYNVLDSPEKYKECMYLWAKDEASRGKYINAANKLYEISGYLDSDDLINSNHYEHALLMESSGSLDEAAFYLHTLIGYKDSEKRLFYNLYLILKERAEAYNFKTTLKLYDDVEYTLQQVWDGLRSTGHEFEVTHDEVFWPIVFLGTYKNSSGDFLRRYMYKDYIWISYNLSGPRFEYFLVDNDTIMACQEDLDSCKPWLTVEFTSEKAITVYNHHDKKTYKLSK